MKTFLALAMLATAFSGAVAKDQPPSAKDDKQICRLEAESGTILQKRVCHTRAEWKQIEDANAGDRANDQRRMNAGAITPFNPH